MILIIQPFFLVNTYFLYISTPNTNLLSNSFQGGRGALISDRDKCVLKGEPELQINIHKFFFCFTGL